jgi:hypothetical protein
MLCYDEALPDMSLEDDIKSVERLEELSARFATKTNDHIRGCVAALDGIVFKVDTPCYADAANSEKFHCRKGFAAVSVQAACDADRRFLCAPPAARASPHVLPPSARARTELARDTRRYFSLDDAASCHDSRAWSHALTRSGTRIADELEHSPAMRQQASAARPAVFSHPLRHPALRGRRGWRTPTGSSS